MLETRGLSVGPASFTSACGGLVQVYFMVMFWKAWRARPCVCVCVAFWFCKEEEAQVCVCVCVCLELGLEKHCEPRSWLNQRDNRTCLPFPGHIW